MPKSDPSALHGACLYTPEIARVICERLAAGETLRAICRSDPDLPDERTVRRWALDDVEGFAPQYATARDLGLDAIADETFAIADDGTNDWMTKQREDGSIGEVLNTEHVARSRLRLDTRKWYLSKLAPKRYGERTTIAGDPDAPLLPAKETDLLGELATLLGPALQRLAAPDDDTSDLA